MLFSVGSFYKEFCVHWKSDLFISSSLRNQFLEQMLQMNNLLAIKNVYLQDISY